MARSHLSVPAGLEQQWPSDEAWTPSTEGGLAQHRVKVEPITTSGRAEESTSLSPGAVCCPAQCYRQEKSLDSLDPSELAWLLWTMVTWEQFYSMAFNAFHFHSTVHPRV